jgi:hypothetical protein
LRREYYCSAQKPPNLQNNATDLALQEANLPILTKVAGERTASIHPVTTDVDPNDMRLCDDFTSRHLEKLNNNYLGGGGRRGRRNRKKKE